jgi:polysaccharide pyruvyl transferase WcaK-like protein
MINLYVIRPHGFNVGNDVIFLAMQHFIREAFGRVVNLITLPATSRYESQAKAGLSPKTIYEINQFGHGVIIGGGNLYENGELEVNLDALGKLDVPLLLFSLSRGRVYNPRNQLVERTDTMPDRLLLALNQKASLSYARDAATAQYLKQLGIEKVKVSACPTIFVDRLASRFPRIPERDQSGVLISVRQPDLMSIPIPKQNQVRADIRAMIQFLREKGHENIQILCHDHRDIPFAASFPDVDYIYTGDVYTYLALLKSATLNISYRLHSFLPCLSFGIPTIKISYDERALSLVETIGYGEWNIDMMQTDDTIGAVIDRYNHLDELKVLKEQATPIWNQIDATIQEAFSCFAQEVLAQADIQ